MPAKISNNVLDKEIQKLVLRQRELCLKEDKKEISKDIYLKEKKILEIELKRLTDIKIDEMKKALKEPAKPEPPKPEPIKPEPPKPEPIKPEPAKPEPIKSEPPKPALKFKFVPEKTEIIKDSYEELILKALSHPVIDTESKVVAIVLKWKPGINLIDLRIQIKNTISYIKNKNPKRFSKYEWDEKIYKVSKLCQVSLI